MDEVFVAMHADASPGPHVAISVADNGTGIPKAIRDKIFDPFFTTKEPGKGTGLGLSTVQAIVKSHGGCMDLESVEGKGSKFRVYLPASAAPSATSAAPVDSAEFQRGNNELVLLADDEESIRTVSKKVLERFGYRVILAENGAEAVSAFVLHECEIAVVVTDMAMPVMDGPTAVLAIKTISPKMKIIGSSGHSSADSLKPTDDLGASVDFFLPKPYVGQDLLRALSKVLAGGAQNVPSVVARGPGRQAPGGPIPQDTLDS